MENYLNILSPKYREAVITFRTTNPHPSVDILRWQGIPLVKGYVPFVIKKIGDMNVIPYKV